MNHSFSNRIWRFASSVRTGIIFLILVGLSSALGTFILQRPLTDPETLARGYSPATLRWLDALGLTDIFHAWWFAGLLALVGVNLVLASVERFPTVWHFFVRPYRRPEPHFLIGLPIHKEIPIRDVLSGVEAADMTFRRLGFKPQRIGQGAQVSLYVERHRFARLAPYLVHASLLCIFAGGIADAIWGYRGFVALAENQQTDRIELPNGAIKSLPFALRCEAAGQENYSDGTPRRWWSKLAVVERGREVKRKEIAVNDPLVYGGVRFFQSSYGSTGEAASVFLKATPKNSSAMGKLIELKPGEALALDPQTSVRLAAFVPDFVFVGNQIESRSDTPNNPAIQLLVNSQQSGATRLWLFPRYPELSRPDHSPFDFQFQDVRMAYFTGLQVAYEPGQWAVWAGVVLMGVGLVLAFYFVHTRFWAVPVSDDRGRLVLWVGASASKNRQELEERFRRLIQEIESSLTNRVETFRTQPAIWPARI